jgi:uncharacterized protein (DUF1501 family)
MHHHHDCAQSHLHIGRRGALLGLGTAMATAIIPRARAATASAATPRLVVIDIMGGLDGLSLIAPYGDPNLAKLRGQIMAPGVGTPGGMLDLGGFFGLHPAMPNLGAMFASGEAAMVHAVGNVAYTRSHFEGQDFLQAGAPQVLGSGWLNRAMSLVPGTGTMQSGIAMSNAPPALIQGPSIAAGWAPSPYAQTPALSSTTLANLLSADPLLGPAFQVGLQDRATFNSLLSAQPMPANLSPLQTLAWAAGDFLGADAGPRIAAIQTQSFDTHSNQVIELNTNLADLDGTLLALKTSLGAAWANTVVMTMTEFGRTAACNGTSDAGTDHGTGFAVLLLGGAVKGGQVYGSWPGLSASQLYQGRDLAPTTDIRSIAMGILQQHMGLPASAMSTIFPGASVPVMNGLVSS